MKKLLFRNLHFSILWFFDMTHPLPASLRKKHLFSLMGNSQMLDGGAMFGNVPKALWARWVDVDDKNRIPLACRALLIVDGEKHILLETGIGHFFEPALKGRYGVVEKSHVLLDSLSACGYTHTDIDFVVLSHLHFDHAGGLLSSWCPDQNPELLFPNAKYVVSQAAWQRAINPHSRDKASFVPELNRLLKQSSRLHLVSSSNDPILGADYFFHFSEGHTPGLLLTEIAMPNGPIVFASDLIPGTAWVHVPITMGYDRAAEIVINEKTQLLTNLSQRHGRLFFTHDVKTALSAIALDEKGRFHPINMQAELQDLID